MKKTALAFAIALASIGAQAQMYGEVGYTAATAKDKIDATRIEATPSALRGIVGYELNPNLAVEGMLAFGMSDAVVKANGVGVSGVKLKIDNAVGIYLKPKTKLNDQIELFGRLGLARVKGTITAAGFATESGSDSSFSYGAGLSYAINAKTSVNADYMQYLSQDGFKVNGFTFGVGMKF